MELSVVILSFNSAKVIHRCLNDLNSAIGTLGWTTEVFVVDNNSQDTTIDLVKKCQSELACNISLIKLSANTGTTFSRNIALKKATGRRILILDSDAYVNADALRKLSQYLDVNPNVGLVAPRVVYASGNFQLSCDQFPTIWRKIKRFFLLRKMEQQVSDISHATNPTDVDYAISACWMVSDSAFSSVGLLDEKIFYSPEDVDYCLRIWAAGYRVSYLPIAQVIHDAQELSRGFKLTRFHLSHLKGLFYLMLKHRYFWGLSNLYRRIGRIS